jgi:hypothetical protein
MAGLRQTAGLKFDHPGLTTTAVRDDNRLSIQNDLGPTDAHVVAVQVEGLDVSVICTDVHRARIRFFQELLKPYAMTWATTPDADALRRPRTICRRTRDHPTRISRTSRPGSCS